MVRGLKEALSVGTTNSSTKASAFNGFYKNPLIKIPFPKEAKVMEDALRNVGMDKQVENFTRTLNRAAEDAAKNAAPIFLNAITSMNIQDGFSSSFSFLTSTNCRCFSSFFTIKENSDFLTTRRLFSTATVAK